MYLEICGALDEVSAAIPLDRRSRVTDDATVKPHHVTVRCFDVLE